jgi:biotin operon repressor
MIYKSYDKIAEELGTSKEWVENLVRRLSKTKQAPGVYQEGSKGRILVNSKDLEKYFEKKAIR